MLKYIKFTEKKLLTLLKRLIIIEVIYFLYYLTVTLFTDGYFFVPEPIKNFVISYTNGIDDTSTSSRVILVFFIAFIEIIIYFYSLIKLWQIKKIGRNLYLIINIVMLLSLPLFQNFELNGPIDMILFFIADVIFAIIIIISFYSPLAKNFK